tara:strand:- start:1143 stop:1439 length:297 start_codon:yes stop_codon:yes gene_type:complete
MSFRYRKEKGIIPGPNILGTGKLREVRLCSKQDVIYVIENGSYRTFPLWRFDGADFLVDCSESDLEKIAKFGIPLRALKYVTEKIKRIAADNPDYRNQ